MKNAVFSYHNNLLNKEISEYQKKVIEKLSSDNIDFHQFKIDTYNYLMPLEIGKLLDSNIKSLFKTYDNVLILDIDCIPLSNYSLEYIFEKASNGIFIGDIQRSNHIYNDDHLFVAPSAMCMSKETYRKIKTSFSTSHRGDIGEEFTYKAERNNIEIEFFKPTNIERIPLGGKYWNLNDEYGVFGIGTTFSNKDNIEMFYHLFETRTKKNDDLFIDKCKKILEE